MKETTGNQNNMVAEEAKGGVQLGKVNSQTTAWQVQEGVMVVYGASPTAIADFLHSLKVVAELDWFKETPHLMGINILQNLQQQVAMLSSAGKEITAGLKVSDLVDILSQKFKADVRIGKFYSNQLDPAIPMPSAQESIQTKVRVAEVTSLPASSVPFYAASYAPNDDFSLGVVELDEEHRVLLYELNNQDQLGSYLISRSPAITLSVSAKDQRIVAVPETVNDGGEDLAIHSWLMETKVVSGAVTDPDDNLLQDLRVKFGHSHSPERVAKVLGLPAQALQQAFQIQGSEGMVETIRILGLPTEIASYLYGKIDLEAVPNVDMFYSPSILKALGRTMDLRFKRDLPKPVALPKAVRSYQLSSRFRTILLGSELLVASGLLVGSVLKQYKFLPLKKLTKLAGVVLLFDVLCHLLFSGKSTKQK